MTLRTIFRTAIILLLTAIAILSGVNYFIPKKNLSVTPPPPVHWMNIVKRSDVLNSHMEGTPFVWKDKLLYFVSERGDKPESYRFSIFDFDTKKSVAVFAEHQGLALGSAFVDGDTFYAFGTKKHGEIGESQIYMVKSTDLQSFSQPRLIYQSPKKQGIFNTSVTRNKDTGEYIMTIETSTQGELWPFTIYFLKSKDLVHWSLIPDLVFGKEYYVA